MARVKLSGVRKVYGNGHVAVQDASFSVGDGEFVVLVGPSGCGKSTTLRMIAGLEKITNGTLFIGDRVANRMLPKDRDVAMVFQNYALYPHMDVFDNMALGLELRNYARPEIERRVHEAADILGIRTILKRMPKQLSGGERQRVALGRAIVREPGVFLFDEPLTNLDAQLRVHMRSEISRLHRRFGCAMLYVTHDQVEAMTMGDRIIVMHEGRIQQIGTPQEVYDHPANRFVAGFIGSPSMNLIPGRIVHREGLRFVAAGNAFTLSVDIHEALEHYMDQDILIGIRPEHIHVSESSPPVQYRIAEVKAGLDVAQFTGSEVFLHARIQDHTIVVRTHRQSMPASGQAIRLSFDLAKLHFFRLKSGEAIPAAAVPVSL
jgi:multiple sugar transport system ATP-binding protein